MKIYKYQGTFFILNLFLCLVLFSNVILVKKNLEGKLVFIIGLYIFFLFLNEVLSFFVFKSDRVLSLIVWSFALVSLVILYRIDEGIAIKQIIFFSIGCTFYFLIMIFVRDINIFYKFKWIYFILSIVFISSSFLIGTSVNGSKNWVSILGITFQPSEFGKIFLVLYFGSVLECPKDKKDKSLGLFLIIYSMVFLFLQKDLGTAVIIFLVAVFMYYMKTSKYKPIFLGFIISFIGFVISYLKFEHVRIRVKAWLNPQIDPYGMSYQRIQGFFSIASGGFIGRGLYGGSLEFVPTNYTDYIFVCLVEEFGILTGIIIVILYFIFFLRVFVKISSSSKGKSSFLLALSFVILISVQSLVILGGVLNLIPLTGVTLPFISYGGSSLISMFIMFAIIQKTLGEVEINE